MKMVHVKNGGSIWVRWGCVVKFARGTCQLYFPSPIALILKFPKLGMFSSYINQLNLISIEEDLILLIKLNFYLIDLFFSY